MHYNFLYISVLYLQKTPTYKTYDKNTYFSPSRTHTHTNERTPLCTPRTLPTYDTHFHPCNIILKGDFYPLHTKLPHPKDITYSKKLGL